MKINIESEKFDTPSLDKVAEALNLGLKENYKEDFQVQNKMILVCNLFFWQISADI